MKKFTAYVVLLVFIFGCVMPPRGLAQSLLPSPGAVTALTPAFTPAHLKGMVIDPSDPFKLDFLIHRGDEPLTEEQKRAVYPRLIRYFLASLAIPDTDQWVNLSPYEKDRIIPENLGVTAMGRDLLAQDYLLKQIAASLTNPDTDLGRKFWDGVYSRAYQKFGTTDIPTDIFNKVWITPDKAVLYEKGNTVYVLEHHLKVMMEKDYLAAKAGGSGSTPSDENGSVAISQEVMRSIIVPAIEKEVNEGKNFAKLRQVYSGMLLAAWYKRALKNSILAQVYADRSKVKGIDQNPANNQKIYAQYVAAFKAGACNMIKEDMDRFTQEVIPRKYFSGGMVADGAMFEKIVERIARLSAKDMADAGKIDASEVMLKRAEAMPGEVFRKTLGSAYVIPEVDLFDPLYQSIRRSIFDLGDSRFNLNPLFVKYMAATIFSLCREHEKRHMWVLSAIFQARLLAASNRAVLAERPVEDSLRAAVNTRLLGLPDEQRGVRYSDISSKGRYAVLYVMLCQRLAAEGFNMESIPEGTRYTRAQEIGATGESYWQVLERYNEKVRIYKAPDIIIPSILAHLQQLWDKMMADDLDRDQRVSALAEYEWWFFQANPFGRGGASIGDAMSLVAQSKMGLPLRARFEHLDFRALSMTLPEYKAGRSAELTKDLKKHHEGPSVGDQADGSMTFDSSDDAVKRPWDKRLRFHKSRVPDFDPDDPLQEKIRTAISVEEDSKFHSNDEFGAVMAAAVAFLARDSEKKHLPILGLVYKARLSLALRDPDFDEYKFALILRDALTSRLLGFAKDKGWGVPSTPMSPSGRYGQLYDMVRKRLALEGFVKETLPDMVRYYVLQEIGKTGKFYRQMIVVKDDGRIKLYKAEHADVPAIMRRLTECWDIVMDGALTGDDRWAALAEYEWWFIQANPFGRGAASMTDAMSFVALLKMGMPIRKKYEHADFRALSMTLSEYIEDRVAELKKNVPDHAQAGKGRSDASQAMLSQGVQGPWGQFKLPYHVPQADANDPLLQKIRDVYVQFHDKIINHNPSFAEIMPAAIMSLFRRHEESHLEALKELFQARVLAASRSDIHSEIEVKDVLLMSLDGRMLGLPGQPPAIIVRSDDKYGASLGMFDGLNDRNAFTEYPEMFGKHFVRREPIGSTGRTYTQIIDRNVVVTLPKDVIGIHYARNEDVPYIFKHLTGLWDNIMDEALSMDMRVSALAEYEWWFFQGLIFGRAGASIGDGMSLLAQLQMGIPIRDKFEHLDLRALSRALPEYKQARVAELMAAASRDIENTKVIWSGHIQQPNGSEVVVDKQGQLALRFAMALNDKQMSRERLDRYLKSIKGFVRFSHVDIDEVGISYHDWSASEGDLPLGLTATDERDRDGNYILEARFTPPSTFARLEFNLRFVLPGGGEIWLQNDTKNNNFTLFNSAGMELMPELLGRAITEMPYVFPALDDPLKEGSKRTLRQALVQSGKLAKFVLEMGPYYADRERRSFELLHNVNHLVYLNYPGITQTPEDVEGVCRYGFSWNKLRSYHNGRSIWTFLNNENVVLKFLLDRSNAWVRILFNGDVVSEHSVLLILNEILMVFDNNDFDVDLRYLDSYLIDVIAYIYGIDGILMDEGWLLIKSERPIEDISRFPDQAATTSTRKVTGSNSESSDMAEKVVQPGGIDFSASNLDMQIKRDGAGVPLPMSQQDLDNMHIEGLVPVILNIRPAAGLPLFTGAGAVAMEGK